MERREDIKENIKGGMKDKSEERWMTNEQRRKIYSVNSPSIVSYRNPKI